MSRIIFFGCPSIESESDSVPHCVTIAPRLDNSDAFVGRHCECGFSATQSTAATIGMYSARDTIAENVYSIDGASSGQS